MSDSVEILTIPTLTDNYTYLIWDPASRACACIDPAEAGPVEAALKERQWKLTHIFNTHHHYDHVGGNNALKQKTQCTIVGAVNDAVRIPGIDETVEHGETIALGSLQIQIFSATGHTTGHVLYYFEKQKALFTGDTLFLLGCGRLFEGTADQMWDSLKQIKNFPPETKIYCGHEYTQANARFALTIDPTNETLKQRQRHIDSLRTRGKATVPGTLEEELATNPFLRPEDQAIRAHLKMLNATHAEVFAEIRKRKDAF